MNATVVKQIISLSLSDNNCSEKSLPNLITRGFNSLEGQWRLKIYIKKNSKRLPVILFRGELDIGWRWSTTSLSVSASLLELESVLQDRFRAPPTPVDGPPPLPLAPVAAPRTPAALLPPPLSSWLRSCSYNTRCLPGCWNYICCSLCKIMKMYLIHTIIAPSGF